MKRFSHTLRVGLAAMLLGTNALATPQTIYRCGNSYSHIPCADGVVVQADDPRDDSQRAAARSALERDKALVKDIEAARSTEAAQALAVRKPADKRAEKKAEAKPTKEQPSKKASKKRTAKVPEQEDGVFNAAVPGQAPEKKSKKSAAKP